MIILKLSLLSQLFFLSQVPQTARTSLYSCDEAFWVEPPRTIGGLFTGERMSQCNVAPTGGQGYLGLKKALIEELFKDAVIHQGPIAETYRGLPSEFYDLSVKRKFDNGDSLTVRTDVHVATDESSTFFLENFTKSTKGAGNGEYIRRVDISAQIKNLEEPGQYAARIQTIVGVKKPWYAPGDEFQREAKKGMVSMQSELVKTAMIKVDEIL